MDAPRIRQEVRAAVAAGDDQRVTALAREYTAFLTPMFHLVPWDEEKLVGRDQFFAAFEHAARETAHFTDVSPEKIARTIQARPQTLTVFRVIAGYRVQELSYVVAFKFGIKVGDSTIRALERTHNSVAPKHEGAVRAKEHVPAVVEIWTEGFLAGKIPAMLGTGFWRNPYENERT